MQESGNDIIVVTFNYRVGAFGFLGGEEVKEGGALNAGILDQRLLLQWVQQHIDKFGGDPSHVTIDGASAGAGSVLHHLTAYGGRNDNLFQAGISDSLYTPFQPTCDYYQYQFDAIANALNCSSSTDRLACIRAVDSTALNAVNIAYPYPGSPGPPNFPYGPCIDGDLIQDTTLNLLSAGKFIKTPLLLGNANDEGSIFAPDASDPAPIIAWFRNNYPLLTTDEVNLIVNSTYAYLQGVPTAAHGNYFALSQTSYGESTFTCPSNNVASIYAAVAPVWNYRYAVLSDSNAAAGLGTIHTYQVAAYWGPGDPMFSEGDYVAANAVTIPLVAGYWTSFVKTYDVNAQAAPGALAWPMYGSGQNRVVFNNTGVYAEVVPEEQNARCAFWLRTVAGDLSQ